MTSQQTQYKPTGINWLSSIPQHWKSLKLRSILKHVSTKNRPNLPLLSITRERGIILRDISSKEENHNYIPDDLSNYKVVSPGQFGINKMKAWQGSYGVSAHHGIISPAYYTFNLTGVTCDFFHLAIRSKAYIPFFTQASDGVRVGQWDLSLTRMKEIPFFIPPEEEQRKIVKIINLVNLKLNKFMQKKKRLIELLKEQKQAIINQAVFRGLDPNIRLKPSGIEWLGDIPEHWEVRKIGQLCKFNPSKSEAASLLHKDGMIRFLAMENITTEGDLINPPLKHISKVDSGFTYFKNGDVVIAKITPCFENGKGALIANLDSTCGFGTTELIVLRPFQAIQGSFLYWISRSSLFRLIGEKFMVGAAGQKRVPSTFIKGYPIALPPLDEQNNIINHIQAITDNMNNCISKITKEIHLIQDYRTRLISDVVTGQIDVRNIEIDDIVEEELIEEALEEEQEEESLELVGAGDDD
ncbi:MAG: restriction endonuclease subunit S [Parachlamydiaceae bacterium]